MHFLVWLAIIFILVILVKSLFIGLLVVAVVAVVRAISRPRSWHASMERAGSPRCARARPVQAVVHCRHQGRQPVHPSGELREVRSPRPPARFPSWSLLAIGLLFFCLVALRFRVKEEVFSSHASNQSATPAWNIQNVPPKRMPAKRRQRQAVPPPAVEAEDQQVTMLEPSAVRSGPPKTSDEILDSWTVSGFGQTREYAWEDALEKARAKVSIFLWTRQPPIKWEPSVDYIKTRLVGNPQETIQERQEPLGQTYEISLPVSVTSKSLDDMYRMDQQERRVKQMVWLGEILAGVVALLLAIAGYIRVDEWTKGYYTGWLRLAALTLIGIAGVATWWFLSAAPPALP